MRPGVQEVLTLCLAGALALTAGAAGAQTVEDLLFDLRLVPLDGAAPPAFTLEALGGGRTSLADLKGQVVLLYFWAGW